MKCFRLILIFAITFQMSLATFKSQGVFAGSSLDTSATYSLHKIQFLSYYYDPIVRTALTYGISSKKLSAEEAKQIFNAVNIQSENADDSEIPKKLQATWQKLLQTAQLLSYISTNKHYFPVGIEVESVHPTLKAWSDFEAGAKDIFGHVRGHFGGENITISKDGSHPKGLFVDQAGREWSLKVEWAREGEGTKFPSGWEINSPPFFNLDELEPLTAFLAEHGKSQFGQMGDFTGIHLNYDTLPLGQNESENVRALTVTNFLLLHEQFFPVIMKALKVTRYGGIHNVFIRPYIFDHDSLLRQLSQYSPGSLDFKAIKDLLHNEMRREYEIQAGEHIVDPDRRRLADLDWMNYRQNWKSRDVRIKFADDARRILIESRILDNTPGQPELALKGILIMQLIMTRAYEMAKRGQLWDYNLPPRNLNESIDNYWQRIQKLPNMSMIGFAKALNIQDKSLVALLNNKPFVSNHKFIAGDKISLGFEVEFFSSDIVWALTPNLPEHRAIWSKLTQQGKIDFLETLGFKFNNQYTDEKYMLFTSLFRLDLDKYPYMNIRPHLEESGRLEVSSNGRGIYDIQSLREKAKTFYNIIRNPTASTAKTTLPVSFHYHIFIPKTFTSNLTPNEVEDLVNFLERFSFYMNLADYQEADRTKPHHRIDSWSLDRYSPKELQDVRDYLLGKKKIGNSDQKYHNFGFRPVEGGLDIEIRSAGDDIEYGMNMVELIINTFRTKSFGVENNSKNTPLFMEPQHYDNPDEYAPYTLETAVAQINPGLSKSDRAILHKLQFEIYKPFLENYMRMPYDGTVYTVDPENLSTEYLRANFESNIAIPLQPWASQSYISTKDKLLLAKGRQTYVSAIAKILERIKANSKYKFILDNQNFYYLCSYLDRSTHASKPNLRITPETNSQKKILEDLVYEIRSLVVTFINQTAADKIILNSLTSNSCLSLLSTDKLN